MRKKYNGYYVTIGLEIHVALKTKEKLFSVTRNEFDVNSFALLDAGVPGILPVLSKEPVEMAIAFGLATKSKINKNSEFERKHYFYPDLPLGYQITQQNNPILIGGEVKISSNRLIKIEHSHLECDAAKSIHDMYNQYTAIDLARCAAPLLEIVSTPCIYSPEEAKEYAKEVHSLVTFMEVCDGRLEEGSFRVDASISLSKEEKLGTRVEIKNISSFSFLQNALEFEIERQSAMLDNSEKIEMETRLFNEKDLATYSMRQKETVDEYRYMPDPDILPLVFEESLIQDCREKFLIDYYENKEKVIDLFEKFSIALSYEEIIGCFSGKLKKHWITLLHQEDMQSERLIRMLAFWIPEIYKNKEFNKELTKDTIIALDKSGLQAKEIKETILKWNNSNKDIKDCMPQFLDDNEAIELVKNIIDQYPEQIEKYKNGEQKMFQFLMGKAMSELKGKVEAKKIKETIENLLR